MFGVWKRKTATPDVVIYTKPDCPLCDKAKALLEELSKEFTLNLIEKDVNSEEKARKYYADRVPVIRVNGREGSGYRPEEKWVKIALKNAHRLDMRPIYCARRSRLAPKGQSN